ncbi:major facilitator superfamily domain-containing protein [Bisporella sp. PMI_857]|nr:major facilitator superfamily domain-containing protein [Bisporella sp. PMI_857]
MVLESKEATSAISEPNTAEENLGSWRREKEFKKFLYVGLYLSLADITIAASALFTISTEFRNFREANWILLGYSSTYVGSAVIFTRSADVFGRKAAVVASFIIFVAFSLGAGWSQNLSQLILFRCLQGAGGSGLYTLTMVLLPEISPVTWLPWISGTVGAVVAIAGVSGPVLGGVFATYSTWRWCFWMNAPIGVPPVLILLLVWPKDNHSKNVAERPKLQHIDFLGSLLLITGSAPLVIALQQAGSRVWTWDYAATIALLTLSGCSWIILFIWEYLIFSLPRFSWVHSQFPFSLIKHRVMASCILSATLTGYVFTTSIISIPIRGQIVNILTAVDASIRLIPLLITTALGSFVGGLVVYERNRTFWTLNMACCFMMLGAGLMSTLEIGIYTPKKQWGFECILGFGIGMTLSTTTIITSLNTQFIHHAVAQGIVSQLRVFGGTIGVAASTIILNQFVEKELTGVVTSEQLEEFYTSPVAGYQWGVYEQSFVRKAETKAFRHDMLNCTYISAACLVISLFTYQKRPPTILERKRQLEALYGKDNGIIVGM